MFIQAAFAERIPDSSFLFKPLLGRVSDIYNRALTQAPLPKKTPTADEIREGTELRKWIADNTASYNLFRDMYFSAKRAREQEENLQTSDGTLLTELRQKEMDAEAAWESGGQRPLWLDMIARLADIERTNPIRIWDDLRRQLSLNRKTSAKGPYVQVFYQPPVSELRANRLAWWRERRLGSMEFWSLCRWLNKLPKIYLQHKNGKS